MSVLRDKARERRMQRYPRKKITKKRMFLQYCVVVVADKASELVGARKVAGTKKKTAGGNLKFQEY